MNDREKTARRFHDKAEECRAMAELMANTVSRDCLLRLAVGYEHLALMTKHLEEVEKRGSLPS